MSQRRERRRNVHRPLLIVSTIVLALSCAGLAGVGTAGAATTAGSRVALRSTATPVYFGQPGRITAAVRSVPAAAGVPSGTVDFYDDGAFVASSPIGATGNAVLPLASLWPGVHTITAEYAGDATHGPSSSAPLLQEILANVPVAGVSFTPATVAPGGISTLVVTATNTGPTSLGSVAMGVTMPFGYQILSRPAGQLCGARPGLVYCLTSIPKGATRTLKITVVGPTAPGSYHVGAYARNIETNDETGASASLVVQ